MKPSDIKYNLIVILGPTATGKTRFAAELAARINGEIISADSRQVYRKMDLGTGKDYNDYKIGNRIIPYHLIDLHDPGYKYNVFEYQQDFLKVFQEIKNKAEIPILCGGTGLYIEAVTKGYKLLSVPVNPELREELRNKSLEKLESILASYRRLHNRTDTDTRKRAIRAIEIEAFYQQHSRIISDYPDINPVYFGIQCHRELRRKRITQRLHERLDLGMVDEVRHLLENGLTTEDLIYYGLEYKYITQYLTGRLDYDTMVSKLNIAIHQFAKRQMTWFRKMEREGTMIQWLNVETPVDENIEMVLDFIKI